LVKFRYVVEADNVVADGFFAGLQRSARFHLPNILPADRAEFVLPLCRVE
jgi:hypothetical protein